jgi:hypothetical protein
VPVVRSGILRPEHVHARLVRYGTDSLALPAMGEGTSSLILNHVSVLQAQPGTATHANQLALLTNTSIQQLSNANVKPILSGTDLNVFNAQVGDFTTLTHVNANARMGCGTDTFVEQTARME